MTELHEILQRDCLLVGRFSLCQLLIMKDANYPWFILVPDRDNISEIHQLEENDQLQLMRESSFLAGTIEKIFKADKINIAALGNVVSQLHIHHVVRYRNDRAWPGPVWGAARAQAYREEALQSVVHKIREGLGDRFAFTSL